MAFKRVLVLIQVGVLRFTEDKHTPINIIKVYKSESVGKLNTFAFYYEIKTTSCAGGKDKFKFCINKVSIAQVKRNYK